MNFICGGCEKEKRDEEAYPAYNHPEAPPICFDCLPEDVKKRLSKKIGEK